MRSASVFVILSALSLAACSGAPYGILDNTAYGGGWHAGHDPRNGAVGADPAAATGSSDTTASGSGGSSPSGGGGHTKDGQSGRR